MKKMKKIFALAIALVMVLGMSTSVFAASIEITSDATYDGTTQRTYSAYKIFDADTTMYQTDGTSPAENTQGNKDSFNYDADAAIAYTIKTSSPWFSLFIDEEGNAVAGNEWFDVKQSAGDATTYVVTLKEGVENNDTTAKAIAEYLNANIPDDATADYTITVDAEATTVENGYYFIVADDGAPVLTLVTNDVKMVEKNTYPSVSKTTSETGYNVGDIVTYTAEVTIPANTKTGDPIVLHDTMSDVLAFQEDASAKIGEEAFTDFTTSYDDGAEALTDSCTFEIYIPVTNDILGKTITFTYTAEVTSAAASDEGYINTLFGEFNGYKTTPDSPKVYTFDFDFVKNFSGSEEDLTATFELRTDADDAETAISFIKDDDGNYVKADSDDTGADTTITMTNGEQLNFLGFKDGTYYLVELTTSTGYNLLDGPVTVTITDTSEGETISHEVTYIVNGQEEAEGVVTVLNESGTVLPSTGGIGTTIFYVIGAILVIGAGVVLVTRRRMNVQ